MSDEDVNAQQSTGEKVGFRDIYRAVGESEARIKEHISLVLLPITATVADHERRLQSIEQSVEAVSDQMRDVATVATERKRIAAFSARTIAFLILVTNFVVGIVVVLTGKFVA